MIKVAVTAFAVLALSITDAAAGSFRCASADSGAASPPCALQVIDPIMVRFDGTAGRQGLSRTALTDHVRDSLRQSLPTAVGVSEPDEATSASREKIESVMRGRLVCGVWTVGDYFPIALHVDCQLQSAEGDELDQARLLGHTRQLELNRTVRQALNQVVKRVADKLRRRCPRLHDYSTELDVERLPLR
ncbi:MAG: hypothetical protein MJE12_25845 [Alphaproteobacteria bacterium]|nr:hypothetical protein [Alphaproteobacteria bacterium]